MLAEREYRQVKTDLRTSKKREEEDLEMRRLFREDLRLKCSDDSAHSGGTLVSADARRQSQDPTQLTQPPRIALSSMR
jgi:hypothetical protein